MLCFNYALMLNTYPAYTLLSFASVTVMLVKPFKGNFKMFDINFSAIIILSVQLFNSIQSIP